MNAKAEQLLVEAISTTNIDATTEQIGHACKVIRRHLRAHGSLPDEHGNYHTVIEEVVDVLRADQVEVGKVQIEQINAILEKAGERKLRAEDAGCDRWTPRIGVAMVVGFAMGLQVASDGL